MVEHPLRLAALAQHPLSTVLDALRTRAPWSEVEQQLLRQPGPHRADAAGAACAELLLAACGKSALRAGEARERLEAVLPVLDAASLAPELRLARLELALRWVDLGQPLAAMAQLDAARHTPAPAGLSQQACEDAHQALALLDLGDLGAALALVRLALTALTIPDVRQDLRLRWLACRACAEVLVAGAVAGRAVDSALRDRVAWSDPVPAGMEPLEIHALLTAVVDLLNGMEPTGADARAIVLLAQALHGNEAAAHGAQLLLRALSSPGIQPPDPVAWLRLALSWRLLGRLVLAANCAHESLAAATVSGSLRWQRLALVESALIQHAADQPAVAAGTWLQIRRLEHTGRATHPAPHHAAAAHAQEPGSGGDPAAGASLAGGHVHNALAAIAANPGAAWRVKDLAARCGVSRRTLEQAFRAELGKTVGEVLRQHRVELALRLLRQTQHAVKRVAIDAGFSSASALCREVRRQCGMSPLQLRARQQQS